MTPEERTDVENQIKAELVKLDEEIASLEGSTGAVAPDNAIGRLTRMEAINSKEITEAGLRKAKLRRKHLQTALERLAEDEDYGTCEMCDEPIPVKRLMLVPESTRCVPCAEGRSRW